MKIRLLNKWRDWPMGTVLEVADPKAKDLVCCGIAQRFTDDYPPKEKMKTEFFKPKNIRGNGKGKRK